MEAEIAREDPEGDARLELRAGDRLLAEIAVPVTGCRYAGAAVPAELSVLDGVHDLTHALHGAFCLASLRFSSITAAG